MAEAMLRDRGMNIQVKSAGVYAQAGSAASRQTEQVLKNNGIEFSHEARVVNESILTWADLILTMTHNHKELLLTRYPEIEKKCYTFKEFNKHEENRIVYQIEQAFIKLKEKKANYQIESLEDELEITQVVKEEVDKIQNLQAQMHTEEISDPYGMSVEVYEKTYSELHVEIDKLIQNLEELKS